MAFQFGGEASVSLESPEHMFLDFSERTLDGLLTHQGRVLGEYQQKAISLHDVAIKLPTGSGKTLVGLLLLDWRRRKFKERVIYVCPTRQLVNQVVKEASEKYGMAGCVKAFTGRQRDYDPTNKGLYRSGDIVAVTTYGGLFNANPFFDDPGLILFDDAHAAENYMCARWTLSVTRKDYPVPFFALTAVLQKVLTGFDYRRLREEARNPLDQSWVDLVPKEHVSEIEDELISVLDEYSAETDLRYSWQEIREHLNACNIYVSVNEIIIRPLIPPTLRYPPFAGAKQRVYMSATLGEGGDLERLAGVERIHRLSVSDDFNAQGVGRRFFILPGRSLTESEQTALECKAIERVGRAVILVPDFRRAREVEASITAELPVSVFGASEIEDSKQPFIQSGKAVAILANRYDGIDFPGDECRLLIMQGLPGAANLQERFLSSQMSAGVLLADRIRTRVIQAVGRCTRSATDYSAVFILGEDLLTYLSKIETRDKLHPELQAELEFGLKQSGPQEQMTDNLELFYARGPEWRAAEGEIRRLRSSMTQQNLPTLSQLSGAAAHEVAYQYAVWDGNLEASLEEARKVLTELIDPGLKGYRALWCYLAGNACSKLFHAGRPGLDEIARDYYLSAAKASTGVQWLRKLSGITKENSLSQPQEGASAAPLLPRLESKLDALGTKHDQKFNKLEHDILQGIMQTEAKVFEKAQKELGELLGYDAGKVESSGSPDPWWLVDDALCFVFEDYTEALNSSLLSVTKARQVALHPNWVRDHLNLSPDSSIVAVLVAPIAGAEKEAAIHLNNVAFWHTSDFQAWCKTALATVRQLRVTYPGAGDMLWRQEAMTAYASGSNLTLGALVGRRR